MSFLTYKPTIEENDDVIVYVNFLKSYKARIEAGGIFQSKFGAFRHNSVIGKPYGSKIQCTKGFVYILHPTPDLWTRNVYHRTQILYPPDISLIIFNLELRPGSIAVEAGTGSGALSHSIAGTIAPTGHLYTFDFHKQRVDAVEVEFRDHGLEDIVTIAERDVCKNGFGDDLLGAVDAVFLDLPKPWEALPAAKRLFKESGGRICCFSPCIEQVQRSVLSLHDLEFTEIRTLTVTVKMLKVIRCNAPVLSLRSSPSLANSDVQNSMADKMKSEPDINDENTDEPAAKLSKVTVTEENTNGSNSYVPLLDPLNDIPTTTSSSVQFSSLTACPSKQNAHSGYLTFATLPPRFLEDCCADVNDCQ